MERLIGKRGPSDPRNTTMEVEAIPERGKVRISFNRRVTAIEIPMEDVAELGRTLIALREAVRIYSFGQRTGSVNKSDG